MPQKSYTITTPIYYINDKPHIGHAYTTIIADIFTRYHRMKGEDAFFLTGTDENSQGSLDAALKSGETDIQRFIDAQSALWRSTWDSLDILYTDFIRTTEERHKQGVKKFFLAVHEKGDIYKGTYTGLYCTGCEAFVRESDLVNGNCPNHPCPPQEIKEENYFFKLTSYRDRLLEHIDAHPDFIQPVSRRNEIRNYIEHHMEDISISRQSAKWGIPIPIDESQVIYVWFDALINYLTGVGYGWNDELFGKHWPADMHVVGKDIIKFHCALWPAMLMAAGLPLPKRVFAHGFFTIDGHKMGKSMGNAIDPVALAQSYGNDVLRYFLAREIPFGSDGDFSFSRLKERYTADLAKGLGNFTSRVATMASREYNSASPVSLDSEAKDAIGECWNEWTHAMEEYHPDEALSEVWNLISFGDKYIEQQKPWALSKSDKARYTAVIQTLVEVLRHISVMVYPFMPKTAEKIWEQLGIGEQQRSLTCEQSRTISSVPIEHITKSESLFPPLP
ncbi:MAG: methionine--tRNA ligase [Patescibacteria group bacterium]